MKRWTKHSWIRHPHMNRQLTLGERAADHMRNSMGSWLFVFGALLFLSGWMVFNGHHGFDPYPFILLNLILSCVAALQGAILLIAAKRQDQVSSELALHDYEVNKATLEFHVNVAEAILQMCKKLDVELSDHLIASLKYPGNITVPLNLTPPEQE